MTRQDIENDYGPISNGTIRMPGKFEGEPVYAPYFYDMMLNGETDGDDISSDGDCISIFVITDEDRRSFPELEGIDELVLWEESGGFVHVEERE